VRRTYSRLAKGIAYLKPTSKATPKKRIKLYPASPRRRSTRPMHPVSMEVLHSMASALLRVFEANHSGVLHIRKTQRQ
jgi:CRISPR/Cas system endoribonuclease Cas6 (RAMP superfamily)